MAKDFNMGATTMRDLIRDYPWNVSIQIE
uniref:Uncharacterized protein n=1 Tax=Lepeophtheirus salmonis TaxID=72036 RepID=A0A0K2V3U1_LEPSM